MSDTPDGLFPITQATVQKVFDFVYAPWIKEMGFADFVAREGFVSIRLPLQDKLKFSSGAVCGQALMAAIDTAASLASCTGPRVCKGTVYQHTHFLRPAVNDDFLIEARCCASARRAPISNAGSRLPRPASWSHTGCWSLPSEGVQTRAESPPATMSGQ